MGEKNIHAELQKLICKIVDGSLNSGPELSIGIGDDWPNIFYNRKSETGKRQWNVYGRWLTSMISCKQPSDKLKLLSKEVAQQMSLCEEGRFNQYSIISLNYDQVIERLISFLIANCSITHRNKSSPQFISAAELRETLAGLGVSMVKLHGCTEDPSSIQLPSYSKGQTYLNDGRFSRAYSLLRQANEVRILGFSLPHTDTFINYVLKAALLDNSGFERCIVVCRDSERAVRSRYEKLFQKEVLSFHDGNIEDYIKVSHIHRGEFSFLGHESHENSWSKIIQATNS